LKWQLGLIFFPPQKELFEFFAPSFIV